MGNIYGKSVKRSKKKEKNGFEKKNGTMRERAQYQINNFRFFFCDSHVPASALWFARSHTHSPDVVCKLL